jgi:hypothetical protein
MQLYIADMLQEYEGQPAVVYKAVSNLLVGFNTELRLLYDKYRWVMLLWSGSSIQQQSPASPAAQHKFRAGQDSIAGCSGLSQHSGARWQHAVSLCVPLLAFNAYVLFCSACVSPLSDADTNPSSSWALQACQLWELLRDAHLLCRHVGLQQVCDIIGRAMAPPPAVLQHRQQVRRHIALGPNLSASS